MQRNIRACLVVAVTCLAAAPAVPARGQSFTTITAPTQVPLFWRNVDEAPSKPRKLGVYATLGGGTMPQLFEFDTGGAGFYASAGGGTASPWWGGGWTTTGGTFSQTYDSGMVYTGTAVTTTVRLFASGTAVVPALEAGNVVVGRTTQIQKGVDPPLWPLPSGTSLPPVNGAFYGDFGMAPKQGQAGIDSLAAQFHYGPGVTPGFRVHASDEQPWVQFGLGPADLAVLPTTFALNLASGSSATGVSYYQNLVVTGSLYVHKDNQPFAQSTGFIFDTGASMAIHNSASGSPFPDHLTKDHAGTEVVHGATFIASGSSLVTGSTQAIMSFVTAGTTDVDKVAVQYKSDNPDYYFNTGIAPFREYDFIYNLADERLTLVTVPEPSTAVLAAAGAGLAWLFLRRW